MDYISHHALHSHIPIHHYTNHTAVTIHSLVLIVSPHLHLIHSHTFKQYSHMHSPRSLVLAPADISERYSSCDLCVWPRTARPWNSEPVTSTPAWYCLRLCSARWPLPDWFCLINIAASGSTRLWPVITVIISHWHSSQSHLHTHICCNISVFKKHLTVMTCFIFCAHTTN